MFYQDNGYIYITLRLFDNICREYKLIYNRHSYNIHDLFNHYPIFIKKINILDRNVKLKIRDFQNIIYHLVTGNKLITVKSLKYHVYLLTIFDNIFDQEHIYDIALTSLLQEKYSIYKLYENKITFDKYILFDIFNNFLSWINTQENLVHEYFSNKLFGDCAFYSLVRIYENLLQNNKYRDLLNLHDDRNFEHPLLHVITKKLQDPNHIIKLIELLVSFGADPYEYNYIGPEDMHRVAKDRTSMPDLYFILCNMYPDRILYDFEVYNREKNTKSREEAFKLSIIDKKT